MRAEDDWTNTDYEVALNMSWSDNVSTFIKGVTGYRAGGFNARAPNAETFRRGIEPETIKSYELGIKSEWLNQRVRFNATAFLMEYKDRQTSTFSPSLAGATSIISNAGETKSEGVEFELTAIPIPGMTVQLNYGYLDAEFSEFPGTTNPESERTVPYSPKDTASLGIQYEFAKGRLGRFIFRVDAQYQDTWTISPAVPLTARAVADSRLLVNTRLTLAEIPIINEGELQVSLWSKNVTNEKYREFVIPFGTFDLASYGELRQSGLDIVYRY